LDNSPHYLFLASGVKNGEGFWIVGVKNCDENILEDKTLLDCYRKELIGYQSAKDILLTSQLRTALILNKNIKATNYQIDTYKKKIYVYGIALTSEEKDLVISEANEILDVEDVIASIILVEDLRIQRE